MLKTDLNRFKRISEIVNLRSSNGKELAKLLRQKIQAAKHPRSLLMVLELLEYTTCRCGMPLHSEYNDKAFL